MILEKQRVKNVLKFIILIILFGTVTSSYSQKRVTVTKKDGKVISGYGKVTKTGVKYKATKKGKYKMISSSEIDKVVLKNKKITTKYVYRPLKEGKKTKLMDLVYAGNKIELYELYLGTARGPNVSMQVVRYYVKRKDEKAVTMIRSGAVMGKSFKKRAEAYFKDCPELVSKLGTKGFKKNNLKNVMKYYDEHCGEK
ncbi:hypothetical protein [Pontimicrobium sp. MEBiC01747]